MSSFSISIQFYSIYNTLCNVCSGPGTLMLKHSDNRWAEQGGELISPQRLRGLVRKEKLETRRAEGQARKEERARQEALRERVQHIKAQRRQQGRPGLQR